MAVTLRASATNAVNQSTITLDKPAGTVEGDRMIAVVGQDRDGGVFSVPSGWTELDGLNTGSTMHARYYHKNAGPSEPASYEWTFNASDNGAGHIQTWQKGEGDGDWETFLSSMHSIAGEDDPAATISTGSVTAEDGDGIASFFASDGGHAISTPPTGMTQTAYPTVGSYGMAGYYQESLSAGTVSKSLTFDTSDQCQAMAVLVRSTTPGGGGATSLVVGLKQRNQFRHMIMR